MANADFAIWVLTFRLLQGQREPQYGFRINTWIKSPVNWEEGLRVLDRIFSSNHSQKKCIGIPVLSSSTNWVGWFWLFQGFLSNARCWSRLHCSIKILSFIFAAAKFLASDTLSTLMLYLYETDYMKKIASSVQAEKTDILVNHNLYLSDFLDID